MTHRAGSGGALITAYEVPPNADEAFLAGWERVRRSRERSRTTALHRALRADADFRFVEIATGDASVAWQEDPIGSMPFPAHAGVYEVLREHGDVEGDGGAVLITLFDVPEDGDRRFVDGWELALETLTPQQGFIGTRLHRGPGPADLRFVSVTRWSSPLMVARAMRRPGLQQAGGMPFASHAALYAVVRR